MFFEPDERVFAEEFARYLYLNPFDEAAIVVSRRRLLAIDLGLADEESRRPPLIGPVRPQIDPLVRRIEALLLRLQQRVRDGRTPESFIERRDFEALIIGSLYFRHFEKLAPLREA